MSNSTIKHISKLPSWFNLKKYEGLRNLNAAGWYEQLHFRSTLNRLFALEKTPDFENDLELAEVNKIAFDSLTQNPIVDIYSNPILQQQFTNPLLEELKSGKVHYSLGVHQTTIRQHFATIKSLDLDLREKLLGLRGDIDWNNLEYIDEPIDNHDSGKCYAANIRVNMDLPDKVLLVQFNTLLKELRKKFDEKGLSVESNLRPDFDGWARFGLLPYNDLQTWALINKVNIPNRVMADAIFPFGEGGEEVVRKTTQKLIIEVLSERNIIKIAAIAANEMAEKIIP